MRVNYTYVIFYYEQINNLALDDQKKFWKKYF
jgi:hypothetical protein